MIQYPNINLDLTKEEDFAIQVPSNDKVLVYNTANFQRLNIQLQKLEVWDDTSLYKPAELKDTRFTTLQEDYVSAFRDSSVTYCPAATVNNLFACTPYYEFNVRPSIVTNKITRVYIDWLSTMAEIGGFNEITMILIGWVYAIYNRNRFLNFIKRKIYRKNSKAKVSCLKRKYGNDPNFKLENTDFSDGKFDKLAKMESEETEKLIKEEIDQNLDIAELVSQINALKLLNLVHFKPHHLKLLPDLLIEMRKSSIKNQESNDGSLTKQQALAILHMENSTLPQFSKFKGKNGIKKPENPEFDDKIMKSKTEELIDQLFIKYLPYNSINDSMSQLDYLESSTPQTPSDMGKIGKKHPNVPSHRGSLILNT